jgi:general secretion pathway protein H
MSKGFTLIELLVVIFIISIVAGVALLSIGQNKGTKIQAFTKQVHETFSLAQQQAMLHTMTIGIDLSDDSIQFYELQPQSRSSQMKWIAMKDRLINRIEIPTMIHIQLSSALKKVKSEKSNQINPQIAISTNGDLTPFSLYLGAREEKPRYVIRGDIDGSIIQQDLS